MTIRDGYFECDLCGKSTSGEYNTDTGNHTACEELATLRAQVERLTRRLNWIRENPNDGVALRFALEATDEEIDDIKHLVNTD